MIMHFCSVTNCVVYHGGEPGVSHIQEIALLVGAPRLSWIQEIALLVGARIQELALLVGASDTRNSFATWSIEYKE
jgi:hypothetical protein